MFSVWFNLQYPTQQLTQNYLKKKKKGFIIKIMSDYREDSPEKRSGCGLLSAVRRNLWPRRTTSTGSLPSCNPNTNNNTISRVPSTPNSKRRRGGSDEDGFSEPGPDGKPEKQVDRVIARPGPNHNKAPAPVHQQNQGNLGFYFFFSKKI